MDVCTGFRLGLAAHRHHCERDQSRRSGPESGTAHSAAIATSAPVTDRRRLAYICRLLAQMLVLTLLPRVAVCAELHPATIAAYERYVAGILERFTIQRTGRLRLEQAPGQLLAELRAGQIVAGPGHQDGIIEVEDGLIHHWRGAAFIPGVRLDAVLRVAQNYPAYRSMYDSIIASGVLGRHSSRAPDGDRFSVFFRIERSANIVTNVVDLWASVAYWYPRADRAMALSDADCIRQVENAGARDERRLRVGAGSGYLWRAHTFSTYLERHGGVYLEFETVGLSRGIPPLLGWLIEPIARRLGRASVAESLEQLRDAVIAAAEPASPQAEPPVPVPTFWCTAPDESRAAR
jgi:hypothetical protein